MNKAVIVAAGEARRLRPMADATPKCLLWVGKQRIIEYSLQMLKDQGINEIAIVVGYFKDQFPEELGTEYKYIFNPFYATTNDMASLWFAKDFIGSDDFVYLHSDLLYHRHILQEVMCCDAHIALAVDEIACDKEMMKVRVSPSFVLLEASKEIPYEQAYGEWTGIARFTNAGWQKYLVEVEELLAVGAFNAYDTEAMTRLAQKGQMKIQVVPFQGLPFIEIDYPEDLERARRMIASLLADGQKGRLVDV